MPVILDGENAWESYPDNGAPFLRALAAALAARRRLRGRHAVRGARAPHRAARPPRARRRGLVGGGHARDLGRRARRRTRRGAFSTTRARRSGARSRRRPSSRRPTSSRATRRPRRRKAALFAAEASDWFWWLGDDHSSAHDIVFDALFRRHLAAAYRALSRPVPAALLEPVDPVHAPVVESPQLPLGPGVDGVAGDAGWGGAGRLRGREPRHDAAQRRPREGAALRGLRLGRHRCSCAPSRRATPRPSTAGRCASSSCPPGERRRSRRDGRAARPRRDGRRRARRSPSAPCSTCGSRARPAPRPRSRSGSRSSTRAAACWRRFRRTDGCGSARPDPRLRRAARDEPRNPRRRIAPLP